MLSSLRAVNKSEDRLSNYKFESIHCLQDVTRKVGFEILSKYQMENWLNYDLTTIHHIGNIAADLEGIVSINISSESIIQISDEMIYKASLDKPKLVIEWVETGSSSKKVTEAAARLKSWKSYFDIRVSIDDIGKGQDGIERFLLTIPDFAKIDGSILHGARHSLSHFRALNHLCQWFEEENVPTVVEWIETREDLELARACGAVYGQGYLFKEELGSL